MARPANFPARQNERRIAALKRIEAQIADGAKRSKRTHSFHNRTEPLTAGDQRRLNREADTLALRIKSHDAARAIRTKKDRSGTGKLSRSA